MVAILGFHCCGLDSIPGQGAEIPQATRLGQKKRKGEKKERWKMDLEIIILSK